MPVGHQNAVDSPLVSVVICNYNYAGYISEAIESVLDQTYTDFELIIVDDGSTDNSVEIINHYSDPRIRKILQENCGQAAAFNTGITLSSGKYIAFLDSDDYWSSNKLSLVMDTFSGTQGLSLVQHPLMVIDPFSVRRGRLHPKGLLTGKHDFLKKYIESNHTGFYSSTSGLVIPKAILDVILPLDQEWKICADVLITRPLPFFGKILTLENPLGFYRIHGQNHWMNTNAQSKKLQNQIKYTDYTNKWFELNGSNERLDFSSSLPAKNIMQSRFRLCGIFCNIKRLITRLCTN